MATFRFHTRVPSPPAEVWAVLTDVDLIPQWFPAVRHASWDGQLRTLTLAHGGLLRARVVTHDDELRRFQYSFVDGMPAPIDFHLGTLDVLADGEGSLVIYSQQIEPEELAPLVGGPVAEGIQGIHDYFTRPAAGTAPATAPPTAVAARTPPTAPPASSTPIAPTPAAELAAPAVR